MSNLLTVQFPYFFNIMMYLRKYYFKHQDISSGLIISFFLLIFQLIWMWYCREKFKIGSYGGRVTGESHFYTPAPQPWCREILTTNITISQKTNQFRGPSKVKKRRNRLYKLKSLKKEKIPKHDYHWINAKEEKSYLTGCVHIDSIVKK